MSMQRIRKFAAVLVAAVFGVLRPQPGEHGFVDPVRFALFDDFIGGVCHILASNPNVANLRSAN